MSKIVNLEILGHPLNFVTLFLMVVAIWITFHMLGKRVATPAETNEA